MFGVNGPQGLYGTDYGIKYTRLCFIQLTKLLAQCLLAFSKNLLLLWFLYTRRAHLCQHKGGQD